MDFVLLFSSDCCVAVWVKRFNRSQDSDRVSEKTTSKKCRSSRLLVGIKLPLSSPCVVLVALLEGDPSVPTAKPHLLLFAPSWLKLGQSRFSSILVGTSCCQNDLRKLGER